jgi:phosphate acyltransferase
MLKWRIGIDLGGGDVDPQTIVKATCEAAATLAEDEFVFFGNIAPKNLPSTLSFVKTKEPILPSDHPLFSVKKKPDSSLVTGIRGVKEKKLDAFLSCGNTGALIVSASLELERLPHILRPALLTNFPSSSGRMVVLDVGGNLITKAEQLIQFAVLGASYARVRFGIALPRVALLNIGTESIKGTGELRLAWQKMMEAKGEAFSFVGNVEGRDVFTSGVDVLVTNGFAGNIFLKTAEGVSSFAFQYAEDRMPSLRERPEWNELKGVFNYESSQGALLSGVDGIVIKCHGNSSEKALFEAILGAHELYKNRIIDKMKETLIAGFSALSEKERL